MNSKIINFLHFGFIVCLMGFFCIILPAFQMGCSNLSKRESPDPSGYHVLKINNHYVNQEIFLKEKKRFYMLWHRNGEMLHKSEEERTDLLLEDIITQVVIEDYLRNHSGITVTSREVENYINRYIKTKFAATSDFDSFMQNAEYKNEMELQKNIELYLLKLTFFTKVAKETGMTIPAAELDSLYRKHMTENHQVVTRRILISDSDTVKARQRAEELYRQVKSGTDFSILAGRYSADEMAGATGGLQPPFYRADVSPAVAEKIFNATSGDLLPPFKTGSGYEIVRIERFISFYHPKTEFYDMVLLEKFSKSERFQTWITELKSKSSIEILDPAMKAYRLYRDGRNDQAGALYEKLYRMRHNELHLQRALDSFQKAKNWGKLIRLSQTGMQTYPEKITYSLNMAEGLYRKGQVNEALKMLHDAESRSRDNVYFKTLVVQTYLNLGLAEAAKRLNNHPR